MLEFNMFSNEFNGWIRFKGRRNILRLWVGLSVTLFLKRNFMTGTLLLMQSQRKYLNYFRTGFMTIHMAPWDWKTKTVGSHMKSPLLELNMVIRITGVQTKL